MYTRLSIYAYIPVYMVGIKM